MTIQEAQEKRDRLIQFDTEVTGAISNALAAASNAIEEMIVLAADNERRLTLEVEARTELESKVTELESEVTSHEDILANERLNSQNIQSQLQSEINSIQTTLLEANDTAAQKSAVIEGLTTTLEATKKALEAEKNIVISLQTTLREMEKKVEEVKQIKTVVTPSATAVRF